MLEIILQRAAITAAPATEKFQRWVKAALKNKINTAELTIRIVDKDEMTELNSTYRKKHKPTNVLSFPFDMPEEMHTEIPILGDIVICADIIIEEAAEQQKSADAHWAHMVVHGTLHLLGYDHEQDADAIVMETEEINILTTLGFENPYKERDS